MSAAGNIVKYEHICASKLREQTRAQLWMKGEAHTSLEGLDNVLESNPAPLKR